MPARSSIDWVLSMAPQHSLSNRLALLIADALFVGASLLAILDHGLSQHPHCWMVYSQHMNGPDSE
jgi:hypothetical protein